MAKKAKLGTGARFKALANKFSKQGVDDPDALSAFVGRKKYGNKRMSQLSKHGRK